MTGPRHSTEARRAGETREDSREPIRSGTFRSIPEPALNPAQTESKIHREHLFGDLRPFSQCHASTLIRVADGRILVAWFGGTREGHQDASIWACERAALVDLAERPPRLPGEGWSEPRVLARAAAAPHWNPVLFALSEDDLILHFKVGERIRHWQTWSQRSFDGGRTWGPPAPLVSGDRGGRGAVKNKPIRIQSGEWLAGASVEGWRRWDSFVDRSPDGVDDWEASAPIPIDRATFEGKGLIQPALWSSPDGDVHALLRSTAGHIYRSDSNDAGRTWSTARPIDVPNNNSGLDIVRMSDGILALACNPVAGNWAARTPLSVLFSRDEGLTWPARIDIETEPGEFSYPAIIELEGGLGVSYTWNRRRIAFAFIPSESIPPL
jgi:predicted neuraminidase